MARAAVGKGEIQGRSIDLKVLPLDDALHIPGFALLNIYFLHTSLGKDIVGRVADVFRHAVVKKTLAHFADNTVF